MGDWAYFVTVLPFEQLASRIRRAQEIHHSKGLDDMIQRELHKRVRDIAVYLKTQPERFFNAIVVGVYGGSPNWYPVEVGQRPDSRPSNLTDSARESLGILELSGDERLFAVDGQHRVEGIKIALESSPLLGSEELAIIFVAHQETKDGLARTRRLFTTLNKYAKPVTKSEIIALDEEDAFAIVTRRIVDEYDGLAQNTEVDGQSLSLVRFGGAQIPLSDRSSVTSIETLYDLNDIISLPRSLSQKRNSLRQHRPSQGELDDFYASCVSFWEALRQHIPELRETLGSNPGDEVAGKYRSKNGGHILFRSAGQQAFARAIRILQDRGWRQQDAVAALAKTTLSLDAAPWRFVLWNPHRNTMIVRYRELAESLFLHMVGQPARRPGFDLEAEFRKVVGNEGAVFEEVPIISM